MNEDHFEVFYEFWEEVLYPKFNLRLGQAFYNVSNLKCEDEVDNLFNEPDTKKVIAIIKKHYLN